MHTKAHTGGHILAMKWSTRHSPAFQALDTVIEVSRLFGLDKTHLRCTSPSFPLRTFRPGLLGHLRQPALVARLIERAYSGANDLKTPVDNAGMSCGSQERVEEIGRICFARTSFK